MGNLEINFELAIQFFYDRPSFDNFKDVIFGGNRVRHVQILI